MPERIHNPVRFLLSFGCLVLVMLLGGCPPANNSLVKVNPGDTTLPDPVGIVGGLSGGGGESMAGAAVPGGAGAPLVTLNSTAGQLAVTATATDSDGGIAKLEIFSNDRVCNFKQGSWTTVTNFPVTNPTRATLTNMPDSNNMIPKSAGVTTYIQVTSERGTFDKKTWQIFGVATNSAGKFVNMGPLNYTAVSQNVPAANRNDGCP